MLFMDKVIWGLEFILTPKEMSKNYHQGMLITLLKSQSNSNESDRYQDRED